MMWHIIFITTLALLSVTRAAELSQKILLFDICMHKRKSTLYDAGHAPRLSKNYSAHRALINAIVIRKLYTPIDHALYVDRNTVITKMLHNLTPIPKALSALIIEYAAISQLRPIAYRNLDDSMFSVVPGKASLSKNIFYVIDTSPLHGLSIRKVLVQEHTGSKQLEQHEGHHIYDRHDDNAYELIAAKCKLSPRNIVLYTQDLPLTKEFYKADMGSITEVLTNVLAAHPRITELTDHAYEQGLKESTLFLAPGMDMSMFCAGLTRMYDFCKTRQAAASHFDLLIFEKAYKQEEHSYRKSAECMVPSKSDILLERKPEISYTPMWGPRCGETMTGNLTTGDFY